MSNFKTQVYALLKRPFISYVVCPIFLLMFVIFVIYPIVAPRDYMIRKIRLFMTVDYDLYKDIPPRDKFTRDDYMNSNVHIRFKLFEPKAVRIVVTGVNTFGDKVGQPMKLEADFHSSAHDGYCVFSTQVDNQTGVSTGIDWEPDVVVFRNGKKWIVPPSRKQE